MTDMLSYFRTSSMVKADTVSKATASKVMVSPKAVWGAC